MVFLAAALPARNTNPLDPRSRVALEHRERAAMENASMNEPEYYQAFISVEDAAALSRLTERGVKVCASFDGFVAVRIPADMMSDVTALAGVRRISLARRLELCNDSSRYFSGIQPLHDGTGLVAPLRGKGVLIGMIDTGIDFNHINFMDSEGKNRVLAVYMPDDTTGTPPVVHGDTLPGSYYETPEQIAALKTDYIRSSHGTHTTGTAAGSYAGNGWYGMAPEANIVACGIPANDLTDVNVSCALAYIFDYADRVGMPCVVNMSMSSNGGPNDGTSYMCRIFEDLSGPGRICILSSGNDGNVPVCFHDTIMGVGDTVTTFLRYQSGGKPRVGFVSMWSDGAQEHKTRAVIINRRTGELEYATPFFGLLPEDSVCYISSDEDMDFAEYYEGEMMLSNAVECQYDEDSIPVGEPRFLSYWKFDALSNETGHLLGFQYIADEPVRLSGWSSKETYFYTFDMEGATGGSPAGSISDLATTDSVISVGAYCTRTSYLDKEGNTVVYSNCYPTDIAYFSSYGPDEHGVSRPDVCAPGMIVMSSANRYNSTDLRLRWPEPVMVDSVEYPYYANQGTSMSAPAVTGAVALMLQVNPSLTPSEVREVLRRSSLRDEYVLAGDPERWGFGKLDAAAAVADVMNRTLLNGDVNNDGEVTIADVMLLIDIILSQRVGFDAPTLIRADVNHDREIQLSDINCVIDLILNQ